MIKRATSVFFLFFAVFLLLANVVIPHHHHSSNICFRHSHCHEVTHDKSDHSDHQHDGNNDCCSLNSAVILPATHNSEESIIFLNNGNRQNTSDFPAILPYNNGTDPYLSVFSWDDSPGFSSLFSVFIKSSLGLRAPPVV